MNTVKPKTDDRYAFHEWVRELISMGSYSRTNVYTALYDSIRRGEMARSKGYYVDAAEEFEFVAMLLRHLASLPTVPQGKSSEWWTGLEEKHEG